MAPTGPTVSKSKTNNKVLSSQLIYETVKVSYEYTIRGFSLAKGIGVGKYTESRRFTVGGHDWVIHFFPDGETKANEEYVSLFLQLISPGEVRATLEFKLLDQSENGKYGVCIYSECAKNFGTAVNKSWTVYCISDVSMWMNFTGYADYMKRSELETSSYLKDDSLNIQCTIGIVQTRDEEKNPYVIQVPPSDMNQSLKGLMESEIGSDITFSVGNESFRAHKLILAARSPVFRAQFFGFLGVTRKKSDKD